MSDAALVDQAADFARRLTKGEARCPGDMENAWRRLEERYGLPWRTFWSLRYRRPKEIAESIFLQLAAAYRAECERQMRHLQHEIETTTKVAGATHPAVVAATAVVRASAGASARYGPVAVNKSRRRSE